jgi:hypothetical protein
MRIVALSLILVSVVACDRSSVRSERRHGREVEPVATAEPAAARAGVHCVVDSGGETVHDGPCTRRVDPEATVLSLPSEASFNGANPLTIASVGDGRFDVRGLTSDGTNSRWGDAAVSPSDADCWVGTGFQICAYETQGSAPGVRVAPEWGTDYFAVILAAGPQETVGAEAVGARAVSLGVPRAALRDGLDCTTGISAADLGIASGETAAWVAFATESQAQAFAARVPDARVRRARDTCGG